MTQTQQHAARKASGKQVAMLCAIARRSGLQGEAKLLEWLEYKSGLGLQLSKLDELPASFVDQIKTKLEQRS